MTMLKRRTDETMGAEADKEEGKKREEKVTPFLERSIIEIINLFVQLFTTPFAFMRYNKQFQDQITALAKDDLNTAYPETVARPLSFFVLLMGGHFVLGGLYAKGIGHEQLTNLFDSFGQVAGRIFDKLAKYVGSSGAVIVIGFSLTLIIAVKASLVSVSGILVRCPVRFKTALNASAYAFGSIIFFQYFFIAVMYAAIVLFGKAGTWLGMALIVYGTLALCMVSVVRVNQIIRQTDGTAEIPTYLSWLIGTIAWQFAIVFFAVVLLGRDLSRYWSTYRESWKVFFGVFYFPGWATG